MYSGNYWNALLFQTIKRSLENRIPWLLHYMINKERVYFYRHKDSILCNKVPASRPWQGLFSNKVFPLVSWGLTTFVAAMIRNLHYQEGLVIRRETSNQSSPSCIVLSRTLATTYRKFVQTLGVRFAFLHFTRITIGENHSQR